jgi:Ser/Thr protein kinase RdoA (MazF antagonist)
MFITPADRAAREVLTCYALAGGVAVAALGNRGGFSGAGLWRVEGGPGPLCLRAWPPAGASPERLRGIHRLMGHARRSGLDFVPAVLATGGGDTTVAHAGRLWDLTTWMPGRADFHERPLPCRLEAACLALARLHEAWAGTDPAVQPCPAVHRRLASAREWAALVRSGWRPAFDKGGDDPVRPWAERAWLVLRSKLDEVPRKLAPWVARPLPVQPCLCDVWHDHVLFEGDTLTGLVDFGGVKPDHVAADLARMLGSLGGDDAGLRAAGLRAYARVRPLSLNEEALVPVLDETGTLLGAANWLRWLYRDGRTFEDRVGVARRLAALVERIERWELLVRGP